MVLNIKIKLSLLLAVVGVLLFMSGCAQKRVQIRALAPAEVGAMAVKKKIAINRFKNDKVGLSSKLEGQLAKHTLDGERYFTVLTRKDLQKVLSEQRFQSSEVLDESTATRAGKLIGAQAFINGELTSAQAQRGSYQIDKKECLRYLKDGACAKWRFYKVRCHTLQANVAASLSIVDVETGSLIYGDTISKEYNKDSCQGDRDLFSKAQALDRLSLAIVNDFVRKLTPHYVYFGVALLEDLDLEANDMQKKKLEYALEYIEQSRMDKAEELLVGLMDDFEGKSYVVAYNLGVVNEAQGRLQDARKLYQVADKLVIEPNLELNQAIKRIDNLIEQQKEARTQLSAA